jgi:DNA-binding response OmpR family regulator
LLVEDDPNDVELIMTGLAENNLANEVVAVHDGAEALDYLYYRGKFESRAVRNPVVVLLDLKLPKIGGLDVLRQIRNDEKLKLMPVVILTSSHEEKDVVEGYRLGTNGYVVKPLDFHEFVDAVKQTGAFWAVVNEPPPAGILKLQ